MLGISPLSSSPLGALPSSDGSPVSATAPGATLLALSFLIPGAAVVGLNATAPGAQLTSATLLKSLKARAFDERQAPYNRTIIV